MLFIRVKSILFIICKKINDLFLFSLLFSGCFFHFGQCIWRNIQSVGLKKKYQEDKSFHLNVRKLLALAFVPGLDVIKAYEMITGDFADDCDEFLDYFEKTWIGEPKKRGKSFDKIN